MFNVDTGDLRTFINLVETGSFSRTAERMALTQPAVSKRIAQLEEKLGTVLVERFARHIRLTEAGAGFYARAENVLRELDNAYSEVNNASDSMQGTLRLACSHHIGLHHLPQAIRQYSSSYPEVQFECRFIGSEAACQLLNSGEVELALVTLPEKQPDSVVQTLLWREQLFFVVSSDHSLASMPAPTLSDLAGYPALLPDESTETFKKVAQLFDQNGLDLRPAIPTNYLETLKMMVSVGLGWSVLPQTMIDATLAVIHPTPAPLQRCLGAMADKRRLLSKRAQLFLRELQGLDYLHTR